MKQRIVAILIVVLGITALSFVGYAILMSAPVNTDDPLPTIADAENIFTSAASQFDPTLDHILRISRTTEMTVDGSVFLEVSERTVRYDLRSSDQMHIQLQETISSGAHSISVSELYTDGTVYLTVNDTPFVSTCSAEVYKETLTPAVILTPALYSDISGFDNGSNYTINFSEPAGAEKWLSGEIVTLLDARGVATVDYDGHLASSMYTAAYQQNGIHYRTTAHVYIAQVDVAVALPEDTSAYTPISYWAGPKTLERACGFLIQADRISSSYTDSIYFQAIGDHRTQSITLHAYNDSNWSMSMTTDVSLKNNTKQDQEITYTKNELFHDNQYSVSSNGDGPSANTGINVDTVYNYFQDQLVSTIILPKDISAADVTESENTLRILFTGTEAFGNFLTESACQILYQNPNLLADTGANITTKRLQCYLDIDRSSGLPIASGIEFTGSYKTEGLPYQLEYSAAQSYYIPSDAAQNEIEKAAGK